MSEQILRALIAEIHDLRARLAALEGSEYIANAGLLDGLHADATGAADAHVVATDANGDATVVDLTVSGGLNLGTATGAGTGAIAASAGATFGSPVTGTRFTTSGSVDINDDAVATITGPGRALLCINGRDNASQNVSCIVVVRALIAPHAVVIAQPSTLVATSTSVLNGTTGADGKFTVSATNGTVYLENRTGAAVDIAYTLLGL